ncbi:unnamed protein product [Bemisia tabaci]|uniref:HEAT repeat-containing protein 1 n=1 Tax=Bemisia tabaci TaxID=7038 RepID=A0A9P0EXT4_BEMTA|nr:PREDICTED: HEAT repeat-containing protein 1 [Bemisia tabaci]CAH0381352.1 unnamed protein product [Bemisia tabaci]
MTKTSLFEQLQRLQVPQTSFGVDTRRKVSLLFDPREAANYDKGTLYSIGLQGLKDLIEINPRFEVFRESLFSETSVFFERGVETKEKNNKLNKLLQKFIFLLSPFVLLKPARLALEWLICRYHIHQYNTEDFLFLVLPYHETKTFADVLQALPVEKETSAFHWLFPLKKKNLPLSKSAIYNRCATDLGFLEMICNNTRKAMKVFDQDTQQLTTLLAFYASSIVGTLEHCSEISEKHVTAIIPSLIDGLQSSILDYVSASYIIIARLITALSLRQDLLEEFIILVSKVHLAKLQSDTVLLLTLIYQTQSLRTTEELTIPDQALGNIMNSSRWFLNCLSGIIKNGALTMPFVLPLIRNLIRSITAREATEERVKKEFILNLFKTIVFDAEEAASVISMIFKSVNLHGTAKNQEKWICKLLRKLEKSYPTAWDSAIKASEMNSMESAKLRKLMGISSTVPDSDLFEKLIHPNPRVRLEAVLFLTSHGSDTKIESLQNVLADCLIDDNVLVVKAMLSASPSFLSKIVTPKHLLSMLEKWWFDWCDELDLEIIDQLQAIVEAFDQVEVRILYLLFQFRYSKEELIEFDTVWDQLIAVCDIEKVRDYIIYMASDLPYELAEKPVYVFLYSHLLSHLLKDEQVSSMGLEFFHSISKFYRKCDKVKLVSKEDPLNRAALLDCLKETQKNILPLDGLFNLVDAAVSGSLLESENLKNGRFLKRDIDKNCSLLLEMFKMILEGCASAKKDTANCYNDSLTKFIKVYWPRELTGKVSFISAAIANSKEEEAIFAMQCVKMMKDLIEKSDEECDWALDLGSKNIVVPVLLTLLSHSLDDLRAATMDCLESLVKTPKSQDSKESSYYHLVLQVIERRDEIQLDKNQVNLIMFSLLSRDKDVQSLLPHFAVESLLSSLDSLISVIKSDVPYHFIHKLLLLLSSVNSQEIVLSMVPLAKSLMESLKVLVTRNRQEISDCLVEIVKRLNVGVVSCLENTSVWALVVDILSSQSSDISTDDTSNNTSLCVLFLKQVTPDFYAALSPAIQDKLLQQLITISANSENPEVVSAVASVFKHISIDSRVVAKLLSQMRDASTRIPQTMTPLQKRRLINSLTGSDFIETPEWKMGITLLELIQNKKKIYSSHILVPILFDLLKKCLQFEEQSSVEYIKQLCLTCLLHSHEKVLENMSVSKDLSAINMDMDFSEIIVECIRGTQNPQTHHHALLVLTKMAVLFPNQVMHNVMPLFTFIGSSVLRQDDSYSFQIVFKIIETVIPVLLQASNKHEMAISILRVFASALLDIPEHRRLSLLIKLHKTLENSEYLWIFMVFVLESYVLYHSANKLDTGATDTASKSSKESKHLKYLEDLCAELPAQTLIRNINHLFSYILALPHVKDEKSVAEYKNSIQNKKMIDVFNFNSASDKELRHFKYKTVLFISTFISRQEFVQQVSSLNASSSEETKLVLQTFLQHTLSYIQLIPDQIQLYAKNKSLSKYWLAMLSQCHDVLAKITTMLPKDLFLNVIVSLLKHEKIALKCRALELLNASLQKYSNRLDEHNVDKLEEKDLLKLLPKLMPILKGIEKKGDSESSKEDSDLILCQQECCLSIKLLARQLAANNPSSFTTILELVCNYICNQQMDGLVLANLILCFAELMSCLRSKAIVFLPKCIPILISHLSNDSIVNGEEIFLTSIVSATNKIMEAVLHFLSLDNVSSILTRICVISHHCKQQLDPTKTSVLATKLKAIRQKLSNDVQERVLYPAVNICYNRLCEQEHFGAIEILMSILSDSFQRNVLSTDELNLYFMNMFEFRSQYQTKLSEETILTIENAIINSFVALVLKYSEPVFRTLFYKILDWGLNIKTNKLNVIIFYKITHALSQRLQALFTSLANSLFKPSVKYLNETNITKADPENGKDTSNLFFESDVEKSVLLLEQVLKTLLSVFTFDLYRFASKERFERFEILVQPLVDQLENCIGNWQDRCENLLIPCIAQMAVSAGDDNLWKPLNYQILLKTQHTNPEVRKVALKTVCAVAIKLGDDFAPLLPETVQFLAELLEDDDESVEMCCRKAIQNLEKSLGESISELF